MKITKIEWGVLGIITLTALLGGYFYPDLPARMVTHWDSLGQPNGYMDKFWGVFFLPLLSFMLWVALLIIPRIDPLKVNIDKFRQSFDYFLISIFLFFFYLQFLTLIWNSGYHFDFVRFLVPALALLFWQVGSLIGRADRNWSIGIRTPWTMSNEVVWQKTHHVGAKLYKTSASLTLLGFLWPKAAIWWLLVPILTSSLFLFIYSYYLWVKEQKKN